MNPSQTFYATDGTYLALVSYKAILPFSISEKFGLDELKKCRARYAQQAATAIGGIILELMLTLEIRGDD